MEGARRARRHWDHVGVEVLSLLALFWGRRPREYAFDD